MPTRNHFKRLAQNQCHDIESRGMIEQPVLLQVGKSQPCQSSLFGNRNGIFGRATVCGESRFDFDEYYLPAVFGDQVDFAIPATDLTSDDVMPLTGQPLGCQLLPVVADRFSMVRIITDGTLLRLVAQ